MMHRSRSLRFALLGAVAAAALGGAAFERTLLPIHADAATSAPATVPESAPPPIANANPSAPSAISAQPAAGPASFADIVDRVKPAVVSVKVKMATVGDAEDEGSDGLPDFPQNSPFDHFFRHFGLPGGDDNEMAPRRHTTMAQGSGFFISSDGYIVTNNHVVDHATDVTVTTADGKTIAAKVIGTDSKTDLALLKVGRVGDYPFVTFAGEVAARRRLGDRGRQSVRARRHGDRRHRVGARPRHRLGPL